MSATEVVKKRGRPKKVVAADEIKVLEEVSKTATRKASTKAATATNATIATTKDKKTKAKVTARTTKTTPVKATPAAKKEASVGAQRTAKPTPVTPETSEILQRVAQTRAEQASTPPQVEKAPSIPKSITAETSSATVAPSSPDSTPAKPTAATVPPRPSPTASKPQAPRTTTIPLPRKPLNPMKPRLSPSQKPATVAPSPSSTISRPAPPSPYAYPDRIVGQEPNKIGYTGKLDKKYRPASRRITAIMVGLPLVGVLSWELYLRFFMGKDIRHQFET